MRKLFQFCAVFACLLIAQYGHADDNRYQDGRYQDGQNYSQDYQYNQQGVQTDGGCPADHPCEDQKVGECWCKYCHYEPCYYTTRHCVEEKIPCKKRCCRYVPKYYQVDRCRYVPQHYCETICRQEPEYYYVDDCKTCKKWVCEQHCKYVPKYYWKRTCGDNSCTTACPQ